ncbi:hypothetical protein Tco_0527750 [Tanacetum coccineum]
MKLSKKESDVVVERKGHDAARLCNVNHAHGVKKLMNTPIYVKPLLNLESSTCRVSVMVGIRNDPWKTINSVLVQFQLPPCRVYHLRISLQTMEQ